MDFRNGVFHVLRILKETCLRWHSLRLILGIGRMYLYAEQVFQMELSTCVKTLNWFFPLDALDISMKMER